MKKISLIFSAFVCLASGAANAQYTVLHTFNGTLGAYPEGNLTLAGGKFYGMASAGGSADSGCIFSIDTNGANYKDIHDFTGSPTNGETPLSGSLKISGATLYGMTYAGGANGVGTVFSIDTNGTGYTDLLDLNGTNGSNPISGVVIAGTKLYGLTYSGGADGDGNLFTVDMTGHNYKDLIDFDGTNGLNPYGEVTVIKDKIFAMTDAGGANSVGNIFSIDTNGANFADLYDFANNAYANNNLTWSGTQFFGTTYSGGASMGNVFSIDTAGTFYDDILDFLGAGGTPSGATPYADLTLSGNVLYGMTFAGGNSDSGTIFSVDTNGANYTEIYDFATGAGGNSPFDDLTLVGNSLYGTTAVGGTSNLGVIFKINTSNNIAGVKNVKNNASVTLYPNPSTGQFTIHTSLTSGRILVYNEVGQEVMNKEITGNTNQINMTAQPAGIYLYRMTDDNGILVGNGKLVIQK